MTPNGQQPDANPAMEELLSFAATGNAEPVLHEIKHALSALISDGKTATIDLGAIPFAAGDERILDEMLGEGELHATLNILGESLVRETSIAGVWRVDHFNQTGEMQSRFIEITYLPEILKTHPDDAATGLETLTARLKEHDKQR